MGLFDIFKSRGKKEETSKVSISVEFTEEEIEAINKSLETYNSFAAAEGKKLCVVPKLLEAMKAQGLFEYEVMQRLACFFECHISGLELEDYP